MSKNPPQRIYQRHAREIPREFRCPIFCLNAHACATDTRAHADLGATRGKLGGIRLAPRALLYGGPVSLHEFVQHWHQDAGDSI
jgi:hypothetical protein